jgi:hypothetical protein
MEAFNIRKSIRESVKRYGVELGIISAKVDPEDNKESPTHILEKETSQDPVQHNIMFVTFQHGVSMKEDIKASALPGVSQNNGSNTIEIIGGDPTIEHPINDPTIPPYPKKRPAILLNGSGLKRIGQEPRLK